MYAMNLERNVLGAGRDRTRDFVVAWQVAIQYTTILHIRPILLLNYILK